MTILQMAFVLLVLHHALRVPLQSQTAASPASAPLRARGLHRS
jgi:hypothetical protein